MLPLKRFTRPSLSPGVPSGSPGPISWICIAIPIDQRILAAMILVSELLIRFRINLGGRADQLIAPLMQSSPGCEEFIVKNMFVHWTCKRYSRHYVQGRTIKS